ncbi:MAG: PD-(D/E)XK nuclease family protein, partial [Elusimicrobiales bacterium]|nr:PD-(D/E)XK nuclease family protein [Elusimicrobiales bacterium]
VPDMAKFSLAARPEWPKTLKSVQLPFYLKACSSEYSGYKNASLMMLGKEKIEEKFLFPAVTPQNLLMTQSEAVSAQEKFEAAIKILAEEILDPNLKFNPADNKKECRKCPFAVSCGKA